MTADLLVVSLVIEDDKPVVKLAGTDAYTMGAALTAAPGLAEPAAVVEAARAINHFAQGYDFEVIEDPRKFAESYRATRAAEPEGPFVEGRPRLSDFPMPDLDLLDVPISDGAYVVFFAVDSFLGLPYRVKASLAEGVKAPDYAPVKGAA